MKVFTDGKKRGTRYWHFVLPLVAIWVSIATVAADEVVPGDAGNGAISWAENCARCHNLRDPSDLRDDQWVTSVYHMRVRAGLTGAETRDILAFLQESNNKVMMAGKSNTASSSHLSGEEVYKGTCAACHGMDGKGVLPGVPDFTAPLGPLSKSDNELLTNIINGVQNGNGNLPMPPHGGNHQLTDKDMQVVLQYIRKQFDPESHNER